MFLFLRANSQADMSACPFDSLHTEPVKGPGSHRPFCQEPFPYIFWYLWKGRSDYWSRWPPDPGDAGAFFSTFYDPGIFQYLHIMGYCRTGKIGLFGKFNDPASTAFSLEHDTEEMLSGFISDGSEDLLAGSEFFFKSLDIFPYVFQCNALFCLNSWTYCNTFSTDLCICKENRDRGQNQRRKKFRILIDLEYVQRSIK